MMDTDEASSNHSLCCMRSLLNIKNSTSFGRALWLSLYSHTFQVCPHWSIGWLLSFQVS